MPTTTAKVTHGYIISKKEAEGTDVEEEQKKIFDYDYFVLRRTGLVLAAILFIFGILVITCGRCKKIPRCKKNTERSYNVTRL
nr:PREDICTED: sodium/potassium-transporting ATPase subunit gamma [Latimeria chalumnae]|eukprot:XP_005999223.1 PREDICTED: sodium/potassium-transporting ATPase subunit gamma [Latimeria chalumnae]